MIDSRIDSLNDRLHNFKTGMKMDSTGKTQMQILKGMKLKHDIAVDDLIEGRAEVTEYMIREKIGDSICYLLLLEAMMWEELDAKDN